VSRNRLAKPQDPGSLPAKTKPGPIKHDYREGIITPDRLHAWALTRLPYYLEAYKEAVRYNKWYRRALRAVWNSWPVVKVRLGVALLYEGVRAWP